MAKNNTKELESIDTLVVPNVGYEIYGTKVDPAVEVNNLESALQLASIGYPVLPLHYPVQDNLCSCLNSQCSSIGKHPTISGGVTAATKNIQQIREWWSKNPKANIGIKCGCH